MKNGNQLSMSLDQPSHESQNKKIFAYLQKGHEITSLEALVKFRCMRLAARIDDLKKTGVSIADRWITNQSGVRFKSYRIGQ